MCIPGDHGAPFLVFPIQRSYPPSDSLSRLQTASVSVCHCAPCSHHVPFEQRTVVNRAFSLTVSLPVCHTFSAPTLSGGAASFVSAAPVRPKSIHLLLTIFLFLCWRLTCVTSNSDLRTMTNSIYARKFEDQTVPPDSEPIWNPSVTGMLSVNDHAKMGLKTEKRRQTTLKIPTTRVTRVNVRRKRVYNRQSLISHGTSAVGPGTLIMSTATQLLNPALIQFICSRLPDPCARAAYLREHVRHELCLNIPFLYVLPNTTLLHSNRTLRQQRDLYAPQLGTCRESGAHSLTYVSSDSLFEVFLSSPTICVHSLTEANKQIRDRLEPMFQEFDGLLDKSFCKKQSDPDLNVTGEFQCEECRDAYRNWLCTIAIQPAFPLQILPMEERHDSSHEIPQPTAPSLNSGDSHRKQNNHTLRLDEPKRTVKVAGSSWNANRMSSITIPQNPWIGPSRGSRQLRFKKYTASRQYRLVNVEPCVSWCTRVETLCPYFNPSDATSNGGEPAFLCDEGHYHHSSRYQVIYRPNQQCETECCYSRLDMQSLSHASPTIASANTADPPDRISTMITPTEQSLSSNRGPGKSQTWPESEISTAIVQCESLQVRCTHHGYSRSRAVPNQLPIRLSNTTSDPGHEQPAAQKIPHNDLDDISSELESNHTTSSTASSSACMSILTTWTCIIPVLCCYYFYYYRLRTLFVESNLLYQIRACRTTAQPPQPVPAPT